MRGRSKGLRRFGRKPRIDPKEDSKRSSSHSKKKGFMSSLQPDVFKNEQENQLRERDSGARLS